MKVDVTIKSVEFDGVRAEDVHIVIDGVEDHCHCDEDDLTEFMSYLAEQYAGEDNEEVDHGDEDGCDDTIHPLSDITHEDVDWQYVLEFSSSLNAILKYRSIIFDKNDTSVTDSDKALFRYRMIREILAQLKHDDGNIIDYIGNDVVTPRNMTHDKFMELLDTIYRCGVESGFFMV